MVLPKYSWWSKWMVVIIAKSASIILVASNLPPRPTSRMITSGELFLKYHNAAKVENSK